MLTIFANSFRTATREDRWADDGRHAPNEARNRDRRHRRRWMRDVGAP